VYDKLMPRLKSAYGSVKVGDPREPGTLIGPLIDAAAFERQHRNRAGRRSAGPSAAISRPAAAASPAPTPGRRASNTINYSDSLPLAQGIRFGVAG
jgi:acyl-CoA reductase-like NAD-dependent aldehyde dehydrogenase